MSEARTFGDIELRQRVGRRRDKRTGEIVEVKDTVDEVLRNGIRIGYIGRHTRAPFTPICKLSDEEAGDVKKAVAEIRKAEGVVGEPGRTSAFPAAATPEVIAAALKPHRDEDEEEEEDDDAAE